jgi:pimeloyl-ACP methyl ester carboxylesterase
LKWLVGHSLGGMSLLNSLKKGLKINSLILIGSGDIVKDIIDDFVKKLNLKSNISDLLQYHFEKKSGLNMNDFSAHKAAKDITIPVLVIHDENDTEVPVKCAIHIHKHLMNSELLLTQNLGHRKILGDKKVIEKIIHFINLQ